MYKNIILVYFGLGLIVESIYWLFDYKYLKQNTKEEIERVFGTIITKRKFQMLEVLILNLGFLFFVIVWPQRVFLYLLSFFFEGAQDE